MRMGLRSIKALLLGCTDGAQEGGTLQFGLHTTIFQADIYTIKGRVIENVETGYTGNNTYILSNSRAAVETLDSSQINSKLVWDCHLSLVKLA